ncbi:MAG: hypothetical protein O9266_10035 [Porphyrobacter sp.]|jgi:hypothetical protein|nr:hypothetical protein [Porphyrobacter sp.]
MTKRVLAPALGFVALASATTAQAQQQTCVAAADLGDTVLYAMPIAYDAVSTTCSKQLKRDGFMAQGGDAFIAKFRTHQDKAWPGAFRLLKTFMAKDAAAKGGTGTDMTAMITALPEESLRPFVDGLVGQMIAEEIKPDSCGKIERGMELLSPLPVENVAGLMAFIAEVADLKDPQICPVAPGGKGK